jgi:hypothetical protein
MEFFTMKRAISLSCCAALLVLLSACATHETVKSSYVGTAAMNEDQVTQLLNQQGYTDVNNLHENGQDWIGSASKDGQVVNFDIDKSGNIHTK